MREVAVDVRFGVGDDDVAACLRDGIRPIVAHLVRGERGVAAREGHAAAGEQRIRLALVRQRLRVHRHLAAAALLLRPDDARGPASRDAGDAERPRAAPQVEGDLADRGRTRDAVGHRLPHEDRDYGAAGLGEEADGTDDGVVHLDGGRARHVEVREKDGQLAGERLPRARRPAWSGGGLGARRTVLDAGLGLGTHRHCGGCLQPRTGKHAHLGGGPVGRSGEQRDPEGEATRVPQRPPGPHARGSVPPVPEACQASNSGRPPEKHS